MVSFNVAQLLKASAGERRTFSFSEPIVDPSGELIFRAPVKGTVRLLRTSAGILTRADYAAAVQQQCARCVDDVVVTIDGSIEEEFLPSHDVRTGTPIVEEIGDADQLHVDGSHEINLDDLLRQSILTSLPFRPLCDAACPGLCASCGKRLDAGHRPHPDEAVPPDAAQDHAQRPFARLAEMLRSRGADEAEGPPH